jgi:hypothetical protein
MRIFLNRYESTGGESSAFRGMLIDNLLIASFLGYLGAVVHLIGSLLWPAVVLHAVVALLLVWTRRNEQLRTPAVRLFVSSSLEFADGLGRDRREEVYEVAIGVSK